jgi:hypothetical protein
MFDLFGFTPKDFSDEELVERVAELGRRIVWANRMGQTVIAAQLRSQQFICEQEQRDRNAQPRIQRMLTSPSVVVETDPDLALEGRLELEAKAEQEAPKKGPRAKPFAVTRERVKPTSRPTSDD